MKEYVDKFALLEKAKTMQYGSIPFSMLYNEPIADVALVVHGEWIKITDVDIKLMGRQIKEVHYKCSACGGNTILTQITVRIAEREWTVANERVYWYD